MAIEVEARFRVTDPEAIHRLAAMDRLGNATLGPPTSFEETDAYLDTAGAALGAARWACRLRRRGARVTVSLKGPPEAGTGGWLHLRPEVEGPATDELDPERWPPSDARDLLDRLRAGHPLRERLTLRQRRTERSVTVAERPVGVLSVDDVTVVRNGHDVDRFAIVELELAAGGAAGGSGELTALAGALAAVGGLVPEPRTKLERASEPAGSA
jgi:inorganic triphosphatase YgiF